MRLMAILAICVMLTGCGLNKHTIIRVKGEDISLFIPPYSIKAKQATLYLDRKLSTWRYEDET